MSVVYWVDAEGNRKGVKSVELDGMPLSVIDLVLSTSVDAIDEVELKMFATFTVTEETKP